MYATLHTIDIFLFGYNISPIGVASQIILQKKKKTFFTCNIHNNNIYYMFRRRYWSVGDFFFFAENITYIYLFNISKRIFFCHARGVYVYQLIRERITFFLIQTQYNWYFYLKYYYIYTSYVLLFLTEYVNDNIIINTSTRIEWIRLSDMNFFPIHYIVFSNICVLHLIAFCFVKLLKLMHMLFCFQNKRIQIPIILIKLTVYLKLNIYIRLSLLPLSHCILWTVKKHSLQ